MIKSGIDITVHEIIGYHSKLNYFKAVNTVKELDKKNNFDLIHAHYSYCGLVALLANTHKPIILSLMGSDLLGTPNENGKIKTRGKLDILLTKLVSRYVDHLIVKSDNMKDKLHNNLKVSVVPNGVDISFFKPVDKLKMREELNLNNEDFIILFLGNPREKRKNFKLAESAVNLFKEKKLHQKINLVNPFGVAHGDVVKYLNASDVLLVTSYWEGSPNVVKEAMACNLPIISVDAGDVKEIIRDTKNCFMVSYSSENICDKLEIVFNNRERSNGRLNIVHLTSEVISQKLISIYTSLLD